MLKRKFRGETRYRWIAATLLSPFAIALVFVLVEVIRKYNESYEITQYQCGRANQANSLEQRQDFIEWGHSSSKKFKLFIFPSMIYRHLVSSCDEVEEELKQMLQMGTCTNYILSDVPCQCGDIRWSPEAPVVTCPEGRYLVCEEDPETHQNGIFCR